LPDKAADRRTPEQSVITPAQNTKKNGDVNPDLFGKGESERVDSIWRQINIDSYYAFFGWRAGRAIARLFAIFDP